MNDVAIICPVRNRPVLTAQTIITIHGKTTVPFRFIACDDASDEETRGALRRLQKRYGFTLLWNEENLGITPTKQRCIDAIDFDYSYLYVTDNDYWFRRGWLEQLIQKLEKYDDVAVIGGTTYPLHPIREVRPDVIVTEKHTGGTMLMTPEVKLWFPQWTQDWHVVAEVHRRGFEVAHLANPYYVLHCGIRMVSGRLDETKRIKGNRHHGAASYIETLCKQVGAAYE